MERAENNGSYVVLYSYDPQKDLQALSVSCEVDLQKEHRSLQVNRKYLKGLSGEGRLRDEKNHMAYLYEVKSAFSAGAGKYLEYVVQYAGADSFRGVLFDIVKNETGEVMFSIFEAPKLRKNKKIALYVPFDPNVDPMETRLVIRGLSADIRYTEGRNL